MKTIPKVAALSLIFGLSLAALGVPVQAQPFAYVADRVTNTVLVIDTATNTVVDTVTLSQPFGVAISPDGVFAYVTHSNQISVIDTATNTVAVTVTVGINPRGVAIMPDGGFAHINLAHWQPGQRELPV